MTALLRNDEPLATLVGAGLRVPLVQGGRARYINLDYAASTPALQPVADQVAELLPLYASVHRGAGYASQVCTAGYMSARQAVAEFVGARDGDVVVFMRNTTDALNLLASAVPGPVVHLDIEHHANLLPWSRADARVLTARPTLSGTLAAVAAELASRPTALLAVTGASNVTGECLPLDELAAIAHRHGARVAVDGAQLVPHRAVDIGRAGVDYLAFSGHKMYAPFGAGVLAGRKDWLDSAPPHLAGGGAVREVSISQTRWAGSPARHEAGTPNLVGAIAIAAACRYLGSLTPAKVREHEDALLGLLDAGLAEAGARTHRLWPDATERVPVATFSLDGFSAAQVANYLSAEHGIGVRDGRFCAHPLLARLGASAGAIRVSLGLGSRAADVTRLTAALLRLREHGPGWTYTAEGRPDPDPRPMPRWADGIDPAAIVPECASRG